MDNASLIRTLLQRPIAFHRVFADVAGGATEGLFLSQLYYWSSRTTLAGDWFYKSGDEWREETGMVRSEIERARKKLKVLGILEEKKEGIPCKLYYRLNLDRLVELIDSESIQEITIDKFIDTYESALVGLSKSALMRATKLNTEREYVDYKEVLRHNGLICHICGEKITKGIGQDSGHLAFDHVVPLANGGKHLFENIKPSHAGCNLVKGLKPLDNNSLSKINKQVCLDKATSLSKINKQVCLNKANYLYTENTTETTTDIKSEIFDFSTSSEILEPEPHKDSSTHPDPIDVELVDPEVQSAGSIIPARGNDSQNFENLIGLKSNTMEYRDRAQSVIGEIVAKYRRSGMVLNCRPNDIDFKFKTWLSQRNKQNPLPIAASGAWVTNCEKDPSRWGELADMVAEWLTSQGRSDFSLAKEIRKEEQKQDLAEFQEKTGIDMIAIFEKVARGGQC